MKAIKITVENSAAIEAALAAVNGKATRHTYTTAGAILALADMGEIKLEKLGLPKAERAGARHISQSGSILPAAYQNVAITTRVVIERRSGAWWLVNVQKDALHPRTKPTSEYFLTVAQDAKAIEVLRRAYNILGA